MLLIGVGGVGAEEAEVVRVVVVAAETVIGCYTGVVDDGVAAL